MALRMPAATDTPAFDTLVRAELPGAYRLAGFLLRDATDAHDATQDALERAWQAWPRLREVDRFGAWFDRIVVNVCLDRLKQQRRATVVELDEEAAAVADTGDPFREAIARDEVGRLVRRLSPDHQIVVALRFWRDLSVEEIAVRLQLPAGTVKSRLHYALRALRADLDAGAVEVRR